MKVTILVIAYEQACQVSSGQDQSWDIADAGTEQMWLDTDGTPYLYYTGPSNDPNDPNLQTRYVGTI